MKKAKGNLPVKKQYTVASKGVQLTLTRDAQWSMICGLILNLRDSSRSEIWQQDRYWSDADEIEEDFIEYIPIEVAQKIIASYMENAKTFDDIYPLCMLGDTEYFQEARLSKSFLAFLEQEITPFFTEWVAFKKSKKEKEREAKNKTKLAARLAEAKALCEQNGYNVIPNAKSLARGLKA